MRGSVRMMRRGSTKLLLDLIRERAGREAARDRLAAGVLRELEDGALAVRARRHDDDVLRVLDRRDHARRQHELLPRLAQVEQVHAVGAALPRVVLHLSNTVDGAHVDLGDEHLVHVLLLECERWRYLTHFAVYGDTSDGRELKNER